MSKTFRSWDVDQVWLFPPSVRELVPEGHLAHLVRDTVRDTLARRLGHRLDGSPLGRRLVKDLSGHNLNAAAKSLAEIEEFELER